MVARIKDLARISSRLALQIQIAIWPVKKIIELNDFVRNFAEAAIRYSGLEKYQGIAGTLAAYAVNRKISWRFYSKDPDTVDLIYNNDTRILSISWTHRLK
jgi:hypothetical protein